MGMGRAAMKTGWIVRVVVLLTFSLAARAAPLDDALVLYQAQKYSEAKAAFEKLVAAEPKNAAACYYLGMTLRQPGGVAALQVALPWLQKAAELAPDNADYVADYGGTALQVAAANRSFLTAVRGRDAMEKALRLDPSDLDARQGLFEFYTQAPWPLGSAPRAAVHLAEIAKVDPGRAMALNARLKADARDYAAAFRLCAELLERDPVNFAALYEFGRTAALSGQKLELGRVRLDQALRLPRPSPASPSAVDIWRQIGAIEEQLGHRTEARLAYEAAIALEPADVEAVAALRRVKEGISR
jgi:tetratricopeptide (TPR) repeat protein